MFTPFQPAAAPSFGDPRLRTLGEPRSALTPFEDSLLRLGAHDLYDRDFVNNGRKGNPFDGSVYWTTVYNPKGSGNDRLVRDDNGKQAFVWAINADLRDNNKLDGSIFPAIFAYAYRKTTGHDISAQTRQIRVGGYTPTWQSINTQQPNPFTPDGFAQVARSSGGSVADALWTTFWGHDVITGRGLDGDSLIAAFNDPNSLDARIANISPETLQLTKQLRDAEVRAFGRPTGEFLNQLFLKSFGTQTGVRFI